MKALNKKNKKKKTHEKLPVEKQIAEQRYSDVEGILNEDVADAEYPFEEKEETDETKKEEEEEYELYYS